MSERKGHGSRGSLMDLTKPRLAQSPLSTPIDDAERLILTGAGESLGARVREPITDMSAVPSDTEASPTEAEPLSQTDARTSASARLETEQSNRPNRVGEEDVLARLRKTREPIAVVGFKLPASLKDELSSVAQYNSTDMTRIVIEALHRLLPALPHPPNWENKSEERKG